MQARDAFSKAVHEEVVNHYDVLFDAIHGNKGSSASTSGVVLSQPWK